MQWNFFETFLTKWSLNNTNTKFTHENPNSKAIRNIKHGKSSESSGWINRLVHVLTIEGEEPGKGMLGGWPHCQFVPDMWQIEQTSSERYRWGWTPSVSLCSSRSGGKSEPSLCFWGGFPNGPDCNRLALCERFNKAPLFYFKFRKVPFSL